MTLVASTEPWETILALRPDEAERAERQRRERLLRAAPPGARTGSPPSWCWPPTSSSSARPAASRTPRGRTPPATRSRTVIAGYHWFTDWGRDTMISLEGLTLATGRHAEAGYILRTFAALRPRRPDPQHVPRGRERGPLPHGRRDALVLPRPRPLPRRHRRPRDARSCCCPTLRDIVEHHLRGTRFGIGVDPADGLLRQGAEGYQLTWMDAKVGDWVVTPRRGKAVEINALWYNALCAARRLARARSTATPRRRELGEHADRARDVVQPALLVRRGRLPLRRRRRRAGRRPGLPPEPALRDLAAPPGPRPRALGSRCWTSCRERLLTPVGLRSLAPGHPDYKPHYYGDLRARDAAYHQGTVWAWLIGPFVDAWLKVHPGRPGRAPGSCSSGFDAHLERGLHRLDQRDLRRRAAVHAARLRRPGLERGRGAARPGPDRPDQTAPRPLSAARDALVLADDDDAVLGHREARPVRLRVDPDVAPSAMCTPLSRIAFRTTAPRPIRTPSSKTAPCTSRPALDADLGRQDRAAHRPASHDDASADQRVERLPR